jgi:hypothetical protein
VPPEDLLFEDYPSALKTVPESGATLGEFGLEFCFKRRDPLK